MPENFEGRIPPPEQEKKRHTIELKNGGSIVVEETAPGTFKIVDNSITKKGGDPTVDKTEIGFDQWDESVQDLDNGYSDIASCWNMSERLKWNDVELTLDQIKAPSLVRLKEALQHIHIISYCPGDI